MVAYVRFVVKNPELMAEAKKMMESPEYQKQMKEFANSAGFKDAAKKAGDMMKDPRKAAEMEAKMEHMMKVGADQLKANTGKTMEAAMAAMADPEVMAQMTQMIKDPSFQMNLAQMAKDPTFKQYIESVSWPWYREIVRLLAFSDKSFFFFHSCKK